MTTSSRVVMLFDSDKAIGDAYDFTVNSDQTNSWHGTYTNPDRYKLVHVKDVQIQIPLPPPPIIQVNVYNMEGRDARMLKTLSNLDVNFVLHLKQPTAAIGWSKYECEHSQRMRFKTNGTFRFVTHDHDDTLLLACTRVIATIVVDDDQPQPLPVFPSY
jgi:hypothetical protein